MADGTRLNLGAGGDLIDTDEVGGKKQQRIKVGFGADGSYSDVANDNALPVALRDATDGEAVRVTNGGLDVNIQDQHTRALDLRFVQSSGTPTFLNGPATPNEYPLNVVDSTGFVDGTYVGIVDGVGGFYFGTQVGAAVGNSIILDTPIDVAYASGSTVLHLTHDMAVDGSSTPSIFQIGPIGTTIEVDITRIMGYIQGGSAMDDGKFGNLSALTEGCVLRRSDGTYENLWNVKTNGDLALMGFDFTYTDKAPGGSHGARFRVTYGGQNKHGVTIRLEASDSMELIIQDDLSTLEVFSVMAQGHVVEN